MFPVAAVTNSASQNNTNLLSQFCRSECGCGMAQKGQLLRIHSAEIRGSAELHSFLRFWG